MTDEMLNNIPEEEDNIVELTDDDGVVSKFEYLATVPYDGDEYVALLVLDEDGNEPEGDDGEVIILKIEQDEIAYRPDGFSIMPYSHSGMNAQLMKAYDTVCDEYAFVPRLYSRIKPVILSEPWTYTHISGVYTYFTGEANLNMNFPDYTLPYTAAHEMAHQRGIAREDEANFVAFLVCAASDDEYIRYSGYLNLYEYVANALYSADKEAYSEVRAKLEPAARKEMSAYSAFFDKYRENVAANVTGAVNNAYLTIQGTPGTKSYGMVVDLAVAYLRNAK